MILLYIFFFLMLLLPTSYQTIRGVLLLVLCVQATRIKKTVIDRSVFRLFALNLVVCILSTAYGVIIGNSGALSFSTVLIVWPMLYCFFMAKCSSLDVIYKLYNVIVYGGITVLVLNVLFFLNSILFSVGMLSAVAEALGFRYGIYDGFVEYFSPSQSYIPYFLYFSVTLLLIPKHRVSIKSKWLITMSLLSLVLILVSGRRAMWLVVAILPLYMIVLLKIAKLREFVLLKFFAVVGIGVGVISYALLKYFDLNYMFSELISSFDFQTNDSNYERTLQFQSLTKDFLNNPLIGGGTGLVSAYIRTPEAPWEYELVYNYLLACFGIMGMSIMCISYLWVMNKSIKLVRDKSLHTELILPAISGLVVFLVINASNPYLMKFDFLWIFYLPIIILNQIRYDFNLNNIVIINRLNNDE